MKYSFIRMSFISVGDSESGLWSPEEISIMARCASVFTLFSKFDELRGTQMQC